MKNKILIFALLFGFVSCKEDFLELKNPGAADSENYFTDAATLTQSVNAIYQVMLTEPLFGRSWYFTQDLLSNEGVVTINAQGEFQELANVTFDGTSKPIRNMWKMFYRMGTRADFALDKLKDWEPTSPEDKNLKSRLEGEAMFLRGFVYYHLATLWGDVPVRKDFETTNVETNAPRVPQRDVYAYAEQNLLSAIGKLPPSYSGKDNGRASSWAAKTFLARVYAQQGKYEDALTYIKDVTDNGGFSMWEGIEGFAKQFSPLNRNSPETIFDVKYYAQSGEDAWFIFQESGDEDNGPNWFATTSARGFEYGINNFYNVVVSPTAVKRFKYTIGSAENYIDPRAHETFYGDEGYGGDTTYTSESAGVNKEIYDFEGKFRSAWSWKKYQELEVRRLEKPNSEISNQIARLAGAKLLTAECLIMTGKFNDALPYINDVRKRVGAIEYEAIPNTLGDAMNIVKHERELELCGEQQRWFDLVRWHKNWPGFNMINVLNQEKIDSGLPDKANYQEKHVLYPIPQVEKDVNFLMDVPNGWN